MIIKNAQIVNTYLSEGGRFMLTFRTGDPLNRTFVADFLTCGHSFDIIDEILKVAGVVYWEELKGQYVRIKKIPGDSTNVEAIGNILYDSWLDFSHYESLKECQVEGASDENLELCRGKEEVATDDEV